MTGHWNLVNFTGIKLETKPLGLLEERSHELYEVVTAKVH